MANTPIVPPPTPAVYSTPEPVASPSASPSVIYQFKVPKELEGWFKTIAPDTFSNYQNIEATWNHPITQFSITMVKDAEFMDSVAHIRANPNWGVLVGYEILWFVIIWSLRAWRLQKAATWFRRLLAQSWISILSFVGVFVLIPLIVWGEAWKTVLSHLLKGVLKHFVM